MTARKIRSSILLVLTAMIWGVAFVAQTTGGAALGTSTFCCIRYLMAAAVLWPFAALGKTRMPKGSGDRASDLKGGIFCGIFMCAANMLQQLGLDLGTEAGVAGFLSVFYIILVPVFGLLGGRRCGTRVLTAVGLSLLGIDLLCVRAGFTLRASDMIVLVSAALCALHIVTVDRYVQQADPVRMSCMQFLVAGLLALPFMIFIDIRGAGWSAWLGLFSDANGWISVLYAGVLSSGLACTLQIIGQKGLDPTVASILMSLESVFSVLAGWILLGQQLSARQLGGCALMFAAIVLVQLPQKSVSKQSPG